jgi:hypothetical protein
LIKQRHTLQKDQHEKKKRNPAYHKNLYLLHLGGRKRIFGEVIEAKFKLKIPFGNNSEIPREKSCHMLFYVFHSYFIVTEKNTYEKHTKIPPIPQ